ncbi:hypothetical protein DLR11_09945 [Salmonella enterica subsp. salamae]|nr:hypothetical protein [Salmonella enterica subsp. salamae]ECG1475182.1 hypothetical protein [Salmonella enterica subsp. salamae]ECI3452148.1 hypothetical protein [Salmonella enterica subsp. salamae]ECI4077701.1 hypothetical protein [Salmonella enterica subsp. salamae]MJZ04064.1 hypothetical protein [Salmonella enterica subsp. salamae]
MLLGPSLGLAPDGAATSNVQICSRQICHPSHIVNYAAGNVLACRLPATRNPLGRFFYISLSRFERGQG